MVIVIDSQIAGISGDMFLNALVNLGANKTKILNGLKIAENFLTGSTITKIEFGKIKKHGIEATELVLEYDEENKTRKGIEIKKCISDSIEEIKLSNKAKQFALSRPTKGHCHPRQIGPLKLPFSAFEHPAVTGHVEVHGSEAESQYGDSAQQEPRLAVRPRAPP